MVLYYEHSSWNIYNKYIYFSLKTALKCPMKTLVIYFFNIESECFSAHIQISYYISTNRFPATKFRNTRILLWQLYVYVFQYLNLKIDPIFINLILYFIYFVSLAFHYSMYFYFWHTLRPPLLRGKGSECPSELPLQHLPDMVADVPDSTCF